MSHAGPATSLGIYAGHEADPGLMEVFTPEARPGWFAVLNFRPDPDRVLVRLFDETATPISLRTLPGGDTLGVGFYISGPGGTFFSQDARNPAGRPQALLFRSAPWMDWIVTWEDRAADAASDRDYDDAMLLVYYSSEGPYTTDVQRTSWGRLKQRFR